MSPSANINRICMNVFLISAALIAYQILLMRLYSINYWHHFAYLIISIAMLGFGASGTFIAMFDRFLTRNSSAVLFFCPIITILAVWLNLYVGRLVEFNPIMIVWNRKEVINLFLVCFSLFIPFFSGALAIGLSFSAYSQFIHKLYSSNLIGSGLGSLVILLAVFHMGPHEMLMLMSIMLVCAGLCIARRGGQAVMAACCLVLLVPFYAFVVRDMPVEISSFKDQRQVEAMKDSSKELELFGALGLLAVIDSPAFHFMPDLSLNFAHVLPLQKAMFLDGNLVGPITSYSGDRVGLEFMDWRSGSLAYRMLKNPDVLVLGGGTGSEILNAHYHEAKSISVVELNPDIVTALRGLYGDFSGNVYSLPNVKVFVEEGRGYLENTPAQYDLIHLALIDSMGSSTGGVYSVNENYLLTKEAMISCLKRLKPQGLLSISRWVRNPPRDVIKLMAMLIEAQMSIARHSPANSMVLIRSWQTATVLVKNGEFDSAEIEAVRKFCRERLFDTVYYPGVRKEETNRFNELDNDIFYSASLKLLSEEREEFYDTFPFNVRPPTDNMPFFSHFFKAELLRRYLDSSDRTIIPFMDWGYILIWVSLAIMSLLGLTLILAPLPLITRGYRETASVFAYFGCLGLAYMLMEISVLQKFILYLYDPVYSVSLVVGSFLLYSGIGSRLVALKTAIRGKDILVLLTVMVATGAVLITSDAWLHGAIAGMPLAARMLACSIMIAPLALLMGMPFPSGISLLNKSMKGMIPWAWGINGFFSVTGGSVAMIISMNWGFKAVMITGMLMYALSALVFKVLSRDM